MFRLLAVGLLAGCALAIRFPSDREKREAWAERTMVKNLEDATPAGLDLAHVNVIWRHGDRSPTSAMVGEKATEEFWTFGGGGYGELSPIGMKQHYKLGKKFYDRYADGNKFLSDTYKAKEIYVHCTDKNRTVVSAMSNLAGMYSRPKAQLGRDYPDVEGWPEFFIPIPIHTEFGVIDHLGDPASKCPRQDDLWKLVQKTDDYKKANGEYTQQTLQYLRDAIGVDDKAITFENVYKIWDNMLIENIWYPDNVSEWYPYYTKEINEKVTTINDWGIDLVNGIMEMDAQLAKQHTVEPFHFEYTTRDAIMYALSIGCKAKHDLRYIYEGAFMPLPTYVVAPGLQANQIIGWPGLDIDFPRVLHGEQYIESFAPLPAEVPGGILLITGRLRSETRVVDVLDKGSGALIMTEVTTYDASSGKKLAMQQFSAFQVGGGKFGGAKSSPHEKKGADIPKRPADKIVSEATSEDQAALYRMGSGDLNLIHIDSEMANMVGFKTPILHGLCTMGFVTRHVLNAFANNDARLFKAIKVRFASPVLPGQTLETHMWDEGDRVVFETKVNETGKTVVSNGYMLLHGKTGKGQAKL